MPRLPRTCPDCRTPLGSSRVQRNGKIRCPECGAVLAPEHEVDSEYALQATTDSVLPVVLSATKTPSRSDNKDRHNLKRKRSPVGVLGVVLGLGFLAFLSLLVVAGGGLTLWLTLRSTPPETVAVAEPETAATPIVQPVANPARPLAQEKPPPVKPLPPPKEPIKPAAQGEGPAPAVGALPLEELKAASVYIKAATAAGGQSGSGFIVRAQGDTAYVVTNHHVVTVSAEQQPAGPPPVGPQLPPFPRSPFPRPTFPRPTFPRPTFPRPMSGPLGQPVADLTVVFRSGTPREESLKAAIVADDTEADLAVLKVTGLKDAPQPIDCERRPKLVETMPVLAFGFPFGDKLDPKQKNPAITVTKGAVSALRMDRNELSEVQLDLDLNPGNSGGPIVDEKGALIGVAVSKIVNSRIGFAVPVHKLHRLLVGRIESPTQIQTLTRQGQTQVRVVAHVADPLGQLRLPTLLYGPADELKALGQDKEGWKGLVGAKSSPLTIEGLNAVAVLAVVPPTKGEMKILVQVSYRTAAGQTVFGEPKTMSLGSPESAPPVAVKHRSRPATGEDLTKLLADLKSADEPTRQQAAATLMRWPPKERLPEVKQSLLSLLSARDPATRTAGVKALAACDPKEVSPELVKLLEDEAPAVRQAVLHFLKERKDAHFAEAVAARLSVDGAGAAEALKAMGPAAEKVVLPYLSDKNPRTRALAFQVVKEIGAAASVPGLEAAIRANASDAGAARNALQSVRERVPLTKDDWPEALDDLKSADAGRRTGAVRRIALTPPVDDRRADLLARLESLLNDQSAEARTAATQALVRWGGKEAVPVLAKRLEGFDPGAHAIVLAALAELKDEASAATVIAKRVPDAFDRGHATQALKAMNHLVAEKAVLPLLAEADVFIRVEACKVLVDIGGSDSVGPLEQLVKDNNAFYSGVAAQALAAIKARVEGSQEK